jgi:tRNA dimethylallyltransferase
MNKVIVVCGPTASGKTQFAHLLAKKNNGEIVNADSMQLYKSLPIITSSPSLELKNELLYHLYNFLDINSEYSVAKYAQIAAEKIKEISTRKKLPILVGGSGMYINSLIKGFSYIPDIEPEVRAQVRSLQQSLDSNEFFELLKKTDPVIVNVLNAQDSQRVARAYEVFLQTGKSILYYQKSNTKLLEGFSFRAILLLPDRQFLYSMCNNRLEQMFKKGVVEEVKSLLNEKCNINALAMKSLGVKEIISYLENRISKDEAMEIAKTRTRQYAKRQVTWFKNQLQEKDIIEFSNCEEYEKILTMVSPPGFEPGTT